MVFSTTAARTSYLTSPRRYAGQLVSDTEDGLVYVLNPGRSAWVEIGTGGASDIMIKDTFTLTANGTRVVADADGYFVDKIIIKDTVADTISIGITLAGQEIMMPKAFVIGKHDGINADVFTDGADVTLYFTGITGTATITIYKRKL